MKFKDIIHHLNHMGFVTRKSWRGDSYIAFRGSGFKTSHRFTKGGADNYLLSLDDLDADDWIKVELFWRTPGDDTLPFRVKGQFDIITQ